jgi:hypothetical protein
MKKVIVVMLLSLLFLSSCGGWKYTKKEWDATGQLRKDTRAEQYQWVLDSNRKGVDVKINKEASVKVESSEIDAEHAEKVLTKWAELGNTLSKMFVYPPAAVTGD